MRTFLLLFLPLMISGGGASSDVKGCRDGWVDFICKYPKNNKCQRVGLVKEDSQTIIEITQKNGWQTKDRFSVYHDVKNRNLRVVIRQLQQEDSGVYQCKCDSKRESDEVDLNVDDGCQTPFTQTAYRTVKTTISCDRGKSRVMFFCKDNGPICEDILSTKSSLKSNGSFTLPETSSSFDVSISNVSSQHDGVYWCGVETNEGRNRTALRKIQLKVEDTITNFTKSPTVGQNLTYWCKYPEGTLMKRFICKGEDPSRCEQIVSTAQINQNAGKFSMMDNKVKKNITIRVRDVRTEDSGTYWCGAERNDPKQSNPFFHRLIMTVEMNNGQIESSNSSDGKNVGCAATEKKTVHVAGTRPSPAPVPQSSTQPPTTAGSQEVPGGSIIVPACVSVVAVLLMLVVLIWILIYQRHSKNKRNAAAAQHFKEEYIYEEIQEHPHKPDSGNVMNIHANANIPTSPSASLHYSTVNFKNCSDRAGAETLIPKPCSSACEYSTVRNCQSQSSSAVNQPSSEEPLYSTVNKSREQ